MIKREYQEAEKMFRQMIQDYPDNLLGYFAMMSLYQVQNLENFDFRFEQNYEPWQKEGRKRAVKIYNSNSASPWELLVAGGALGVSGFDKAHRGDWWGGLNDGVMAIRLLRKAKFSDPQFADADLGIGLYEYWRSVFTKRLWFLPFFADRRTIGIAAVHNAMDHGHFTPILATMALSFIHVEEKKEEEALSLLEELLQQVPQNIILKTLYGSTLSHQKKFDMAEKEFRQILAIDPAITKTHLHLAINGVRQQKNLDEASRELDLFFQDCRQNQWLATGHFYRGEIAALKNEKAQAIQEYKTALRYNKKIPGPKKRLAELEK